MGFSAHRGTAGHTIGMEVIGKDNPSGTSKLTNPVQGIDPSTHRLKRINVDFGDNGGVSVQHSVMSLKPKKGDSEYDPRNEQTHMFRNADQAHAHIGQLMGLRLASGTVKE
jgi:hypothetical protein